jgi:FkbM family methyltransferase
VLSPQEAARRYRNDANFLITIWRGEGTDRMAQREAQLRGLGCRHVVPFQPLFWKYPQAFLPHYAVDLPHKVLQQQDEVRQVGNLWTDAASRGEYLAQLRWRVLGDFAMPDPVQHTIYFPLELCPLTDSEVFIDCGAYNGDSIRSFLEQPKQGFKRIYSFEPDPVNFRILEKEVSTYPERNSITLQCAAVGAHKGKVAFSADGNEASHQVGKGDMVVDCITLDEALSGAEPTYLKMDVEGAEPDALLGAHETIRRHSPVLAVCVYHLQNHLWKIPLLIQSINPNYNFFLRPHLLEGWDLVVYAIPDHRLARSFTQSRAAL